MYLAKITNTISKWYKNIFRISKYGCMYGSSLLLTFLWNKNTFRALEFYLQNKLFTHSILLKSIKM